MEGDSIKCYIYQISLNYPLIFSSFFWRKCYFQLISDQLLEVSVSFIIQNAWWKFWLVSFAENWLATSPEYIPIFGQKYCPENILWFKILVLTWSDYCILFVDFLLVVDCLQFFWSCFIIFYYAFLNGFLDFLNFLQGFQLFFLNFLLSEFLFYNFLFYLNF